MNDFFRFVSAQRGGFKPFNQGYKMLLPMSVEEIVSAGHKKFPGHSGVQKVIQLLPNLRIHFKCEEK